MRSRHWWCKLRSRKE